MVEIRSHKVGPSDCRSLGSNQHQSGRSAKISIGITVEKSPTVISGVGKEGATAVHSAEKLTSCRRVQSRPHEPLNLETTKVELKGQKNSSLSCRKTSNAPVLDGRLSHGYARDEDEGQLTFATMQKSKLVDQELSRESPPGEMDNNTTDGLKVKLWEILGGVSSQNEHSTTSPKRDENTNNVDRSGMVKPSSDPIETDSDSPDQTVRRPATRSMTKKKTPTKLMKNLDDALHNGKKLLSSTSSDYKHKAEENLKGRENDKLFFTFGIEENRRMSVDKNAFKKSKSDIQLSKISPSGSDNNQTNFNDKEDVFSFAEVVGNKTTLEKSNSAQSKRLNEKTKATVEKRTINPPSRSTSNKSFPSPSKGLQHMNDIDTCPSLPRASKKQFLHSKNAHLNGSQNSVKPKFVFQHVKAACSTSIDVSDDLPSPTLAGNMTPVTPSRPSNDISGSPLQSGKINFSWNVNNSDIMEDNDKPKSCGSEANTESSDDTREVYESRDLEPTFVDRNETKEQLSLSPLARHDSDSFGEKELKIKEVGQTNKWFESVEKSEKAPFKLHKKRRVHDLKDAKLLEGDETNDLHDASGQCIEEDNLTRAVNQLALALRRIKSKIHLHTNKKSCEILAVVADKIKLQLQNADSQIQEEMGQFIGASKSKRKRLESRFEEHQERLRLIHDKFKEEVNQQLHNCCNTLEELEAKNLEIKGTADRQKVLHKKLVLRIEEAMKDELTAAETSITTIRKDARKKLNSLKFALEEWLQD